MATLEDFLELDIRVGKIVKVEDVPPDVRKPVYKLEIDFGKEVGVKKSMAGVTARYSKEQLLGRLVLAVVNFPPRQMGKHVSEVLTLGVDDEKGDIVLIKPDWEVFLGSRLH